MRIFFALVFTLFASLPAHASPPQVISVEETLISIGGPGGGPGQFIFVLRELKDNMGSHSRRQIDVVLIARSIATNDDVYLWPISRTLDNGPGHVETDGNPRVVTVPLDEEYNPWRVADIHHGGHPNQIKADENSGIEVLSNKDGVLISVKTPSFAYDPPEGTPERTSYWVSYGKLAKEFEYSLSNTRYSFRPYFIESTDPLISPQFNPEQDCKFDYFAELSEQTDGAQQGFWVAYVTCENENTMAPVSMFITLQPLP